MALIKCLECGKEISSMAPACPRCGAPSAAASQSADPTTPQRELVIDQSTVHEQLAEMQGGSTCPFCKHFLPAGAEVCRCGAYYGHKNASAPRTFKRGRNFVVVAIVFALVGVLLYIKRVDEIADFVFVIGGGFALAGVIMGFGGLLAMVGGRKWWRRV